MRNSQIVTVRMTKNNNNNNGRKKDTNNQIKVKTRLINKNKIELLLVFIEEYYEFHDVNDKQNPYMMHHLSGSYLRQGSS